MADIVLIMCFTPCREINTKLSVQTIAKRHKSRKSTMENLSPSDLKNRGETEDVLTERCLFHKGINVMPLMRGPRHFMKIKTD